MKRIPLAHIKQIFSGRTSGSVSMQKRFAFYILSFVCAFCAFLLILLNLFGIINPAGYKIDETMGQHLRTYSAQMDHDLDQLAAHAASFAGQIASVTEHQLAEQGLSFAGLENNPEALTRLQLAAYPTVFSNLQLAPCSGAFYTLFTTVNRKSGEESYNGIYLRYTNIYAENTLNSKICMYRGASKVARENGINLDSAWKNEMSRSLFSDETDPSGNFYLSRIHKLPDTWESARFLYAPIVSPAGKVIGICGFEICDLYFQFSHGISDARWPYLVCGVLEEKDGIYTGQFSGRQSGSIPLFRERFILEGEGRFTGFQGQESSYVGKMQEVSAGSETRWCAVMIPGQQYRSLMRAGRLRMIFLLLIVGGVSIGACFWLSKRYVRPILHDLEKIRSEDEIPGQPHIQELGELFDFVAQKNRLYQEELEQRNREKQEALSQYVTAREAYTQAKQQYETAQNELAKLSASAKQEVDPEQFRMFIDSLHTLTPTEAKIFGLYLDGKTGKDILELLSIKENTLKYHNKNIYSKLGVSSRKQLLQYAALMSEQKPAGFRESRSSGSIS